MKSFFSLVRNKEDKNLLSDNSRENMIKKLKAEKKQHVSSAVICFLLFVFCAIFFSDYEMGFIRYPELYLKFIETGYIVIGYFVFAVILFCRDIILAVQAHRICVKLEIDDDTEVITKTKASGKLKKIFSTVLALILPLFGAIEFFSMKTYGIFEDSSDIYITLNDIGVSGERSVNPYNGVNGGVRENNSLFADCWHVSEFLKTESGENKLLYQDIYIIKNEKMVESFTRALMGNALFAKSESRFVSVDIEGLDRAYVAATLECIAVKGNKVCFMTSVFDSEAMVSEALTAISTKWQN